MKYYIPTSSLNLDNILQSESISPSSFYAMRKTGYKTIEVLCEFKGINNKLLLFRYPIRFTIEDPNRYNFPLLIEVEDENQLTENKLCLESDGVFSFSDIIYLTPTNCRLFFFSEHAYKLTTINTSSNKAIKFYTNYKIFPTTTGLQLREMPFFRVPDESYYPESHETELDKKKGLLYAFLLGQNLSVSPELAHQNKLTQDIYDIISGILANFSRSEMFKTKLCTLLEDYRGVDQTEQKNYLRFNNSLDVELGRFKFLKSGLITLLKKWEVWDAVYRKLSKKWGCEMLPTMSGLNSREDFKKLSDEVERRTQLSIDYYKRTKQNCSLDVIGFKDKITIKGQPLLSIAANYIVKNQLIPEQLSAHRKDVCLGMINEIKDFYIAEYGDKAWNDAPRSYFNTLYAHIQNIGTTFDIKAINNMEMSAIAAFLLKGHSIDGYLVYLKMKEFSDYTGPLVLWGALCGYMEMNKDVLSSIISMDHFEDVYRHLYGKDIYKAVWEQTKDSSTIYEKSEFAATAAEEITDNVGKTEAVDEMALHVWQQGILKFAKETIKKNKQLLISSLQQTLVANGNNTDYIKFLKLLLNYDGWTTQKKEPTTAWKKMQEHFAPNYFYNGKEKKKKYKGKNVINNSHQKTFFEESKAPNEDYEINTIPSSSLFVEDSNVGNFILTCTYLPNEIRESLSKKVFSFQKGYSPNGKYASKPNDNPRDNKSTTEHFKHWCFYDKGKYPPILENSADNRKYFDMLVMDLIKRYEDR